MPNLDLSAGVSVRKMLEDFHAVLKVGSQADLISTTVKLMQPFGFSNFLFSRWSAPDGGEKNRFRTVTTFDDKWIEKYYREAFFKHDPALIHCQQSWTPLPWTRALFDHPDARPIYEEACLYGISAGCAIPIVPAECGFSYVRDQEADKGLKDALAALPYMTILSGFLMEATQNMETGKCGAVGRSSLSLRELECIKHLMNGLRDAEIAEKMNITRRTVSAHVANAKMKTHSVSRSQLIAFCMKAGHL